MTDIILPHSLEAEEAVIGSALIDSDAISMIDLAASDFFIHRNRFIWAAIQAIHAEGLAVDYVTVTAELERRHQLDDIGGPAALYDMINSAPNFNHVQSYAATIRKNAQSRKHAELAQTILKQSLNGGVDVASAIEVLTSSSATNNDGVHISEAFDDYEQFLVERMANPVDVWGIPTGFKDWDIRTGGLHKKMVTLLSGESGTGKTTILLQAALNAAKEGYGVAIFEKEMSQDACINRMVELETGIPYRAMMTGRMTADQFQKFKACKAKLSKLHIFVNEDPATTTADIRGIVARVRTRMPVDITYLDYLGLLGDTADGNRNDWDQTKAINFRATCKAMDMSGFAIQDMVKHGGGVPTLDDISGGAKVRFGADVIFAVIQDDDNDRMHYLIPLKERYGDMAKKRVALVRNGLPFYDWTPERERR